MKIKLVERIGGIVTICYGLDPGQFCRTGIEIYLNTIIDLLLKIILAGGRTVVNYTYYYYNKKGYYTCREPAAFRIVS